MQPRAAEAATSEALAVALIAAAAEDAEAAPAEPAAAADAVHSVQGGVPSAPDQEAPAAPASAAAVPGSQAAAGGSVARGLALAAQLPAGTKIVGARSPGSSGSATWGIGVRRRVWCCCVLCSRQCFAAVVACRIRTRGR